MCLSATWGLTNDYQVEENQNTGKISLGLSVIMRVTLRDGTFHEVKESLQDMNFWWVVVLTPDLF